MLMLYYSPCACSLAPHILLEEIDIPFKVVLVFMARSETRSAEYLAINPKRLVPALTTDDGQILTEVPVICWYLAQQSKHSQLVPDRMLDVAHCLEWFNWLSGTAHNMSFAQIWRPGRFVGDESKHQAIGTTARAKVPEYFRYIEQKLDGHDWAVGDTYTVVDPYLLVFFRWGNRIGFNMRNDYPGWTRHTERVLQRPAVQRTLTREGINVWDKAA